MTYPQPQPPAPPACAAPLDGHVLCAAEAASLSSSCRTVRNAVALILTLEVSRLLRAPHVALLRGQADVFDRIPEIPRRFRLIYITLV